MSVAEAATAPTVIAESARIVPGGRSIEVTVGQAEIASRITSTSAATGFMVGGLLGAAIDSSRAKGHEDVITQVRDSLLDFDTDGLAISTTRDALAGVDWMQPADIKFSKDSSLFGKSEFLDTGDAAQAAFFDYYYELLPDFTAIRVVVTVTFINKASPNPKKLEARFSNKNAVYTAMVTSTVSLTIPRQDIKANAAVWSANRGQSASEALNRAFGNAGKVLARALVVNQEDHASLKKTGFTVDTRDGGTAKVTLVGGNYEVADTVP